MDHHRVDGRNSGEVVVQASTVDLVTDASDDSIERLEDHLDGAVRTLSRLRMRSASRSEWTVSHLSCSR